MRIWQLLVPLLLHPIAVSCRGVSLPPPPHDPPPSDHTAQFPWKSQRATAADHTQKTEFYALAHTAQQQQLPHFAHYLQHYLSNTGTDADIAPDELLAALPRFYQEVHTLVSFKARLAAQDLIAGARPTVQFSSFWHEYATTSEEGWDWFLALDRFRYSVTGAVRLTADDDRPTVQFRVDVLRSFDFAAGRQLQLGQFQYHDSQLVDLQVKGLAREFMIRGSSQGYYLEEGGQGSQDQPDQPDQTKTMTSVAL
ncbi:uncharacterized protein BP01DRAFT_380429 [Aspergillus saccharolyticus JOP 1030-1]|uniref:SnoaL-like domain-containing protein n=1 Tax=Aspergillus saccharolyticus JOP 1030-1 TaxID=1450539 RepID=A0A318ZJW5_9EURO|nr:hypothetical protein BP01DRAFT_380429 [Aspergillus saccharolyticus JOP 1030-1]PYH47871.1 hypothetical protein BP01DRAFT_380429 [Aspergillus saccharolyticus JOP 1030-1]